VRLPGIVAKLISIFTFQRMMMKPKKKKLQPVKLRHNDFTCGECSSSIMMGLQAYHDMKNKKYYHDYCTSD
jgi:hypothetical protein